MLALAFLMNYSGATATLGLAFAGTGRLFPFFSALLGWLGVFLTGSGPSSNALFGNLQVVTANRLGLSPVLMASANSAGGVMGKMISLQSIAVACAAAGLGREDESRLFRFTLRHSIVLADDRHHRYDLRLRRQRSLIHRGDIGDAGNASVNALLSSCALCVSAVNTCLSPPVPPHVLRLGEHVAAQGSVEGIALRSGAQAQARRVQRMQSEEVAVRRAAWRAGPVVAQFAEIVRAALSQLAWLEPLRRGVQRGGNIPGSQWFQVPAGASGSSTIRAKLLVSRGSPDHSREGERSAPSQVSRFGIAPPSANAPIISLNAIIPPKSRPLRMVLQGGLASRSC